MRAKMQEVEGAKTARDLVPPDTDTETVTIFGDRIVFVSIKDDYDVECPSDFGGWRLYSFSRKHASFAHADDFDSDDLKSKFARGLAFVLDYFEHGTCHWSLSCEDAPGTEYQWDGVRGAGLLIWEGKESDLSFELFERRKEWARSFVDVYTKWANGECYGYSFKIYKVRRVSDVEVFDRPSDYRHDEPLAEDSCGGYIGWEDVVSQLVDALEPHVKEAIDAANVEG